MNAQELKNSLIKLGSENPNLRAHIRPILDKMASHVVGETRLSRREKQQINAEITRRGLDGKGRFKGVGRALKVIWELLDDHGVVLLNGMFDSYAYTSSSGNATELLGKPLDISGDETEEIINAMLVIQWHDFEDSDFTEVVVYVS